MYNSSGNNFFIRAKQTVYKWWCVIYKPVYKLFHQGHWPEGKDPYYHPPQGNAAGQSEDTSAESDAAQRLLAEQMARQIEELNQHQVDSIILSTDPAETAIPEANVSIAIPDTDDTISEEITQTQDTTQGPYVSDDVMAKAQEIMDRLAREAAEDEAKKQAEIDAAKQAAKDQERLASIIKANERDISIYIEEGKAHQADNNPTSQKGD